MSKMCRRATRWCPTPEQVIILQELYRGGLRTPKAPLIQKITAHLSLYGKIEGKNVFYWFQNHKARDRQKLRKILSNQLLFGQQEINFNIQTKPFVYPHHLHSNDPHPPGYHHHHPQHGPATFIYQGMGEDASRGGYYAWNMGDDLPKSCVAQNGFTTTSRHDCVMMEGPTTSIPSCNSTDYRPLQTLDLFPTRTHL